MLRTASGTYKSFVLPTIIQREPERQRAPRTFWVLVPGSQLALEDRAHSWFRFAKVVISLSAECDLGGRGHMTTLNLGRPMSTVSAAPRLLGTRDGVSRGLSTSTFSMASG